MKCLNREKLESEKAIDFCVELDEHNIDLNTFIKLYNKWAYMNTKERGECIDNILWK